MEPTLLIWKYEIFRPGAFTLELPQGAKLLYVASQQNKPYMWFQVDPLEDLERRRFVLLATGIQYAVTGRVDYHGSLQMDDGALIYHLFELEPLPEIEEAP